MDVNLTYFRQSGKVYSSGQYYSDYFSLNDIWKEVRELRFEGRLPDLVPGNHLEFIVLVDVPEHDHNHLRLIV
jgi:hypothetical protein